MLALGQILYYRINNCKRLITHIFILLMYHRLQSIIINKKGGMMRRTSILFLFISLVTFLFVNSSLYAGGLEDSKAGANTERTKVQKVVDAALQPGTYQFAEKLVKLVGDGLDWYFDRLVVGADKAQVPQISDDIVNGIGLGLGDLQVDRSIDSVLNGVAGLAHKFYIADFDKKILKGTDVQVKPYFKSGIEYDSNVFYEPEFPKTRDDVIWTWTPGVSVNFPFGDQKQYRVGAVYEARLQDFTRNAPHDNVGQSFGALADFKLTDAIYVKATEEFVDDTARAGTVAAKRVFYTDNRVSPTVGYNWRDWTGEFQYEHALRRFDASIFNIFEYDNSVFTGRLYRTLAPNFRGLLEYNFSRYHYIKDATRNGDYHQFRMGVVGKLSERTDILGRIGYQDRNYERRGNLFSSEFDKPVGDIRLQHKLTNRTDLDFSYERTAHETTFTANRFYEEHILQGQGIHLFNAKFRGRAGASFARHDFPATAVTGLVAVKRKDAIGTAFVGLDYAFRPWMIWNLDYKYERSNSNNSNFDYTNNQVAVGMTMPL